MKVKLFRKGKLVGYVMPYFHCPQREEENRLFWDKLELPIIG